MSKRQLPARKNEFIRVTLPALATLFFLAALQTLLLSYSICSGLAGDFLLSGAFGLFALVFLWATGPLYVALPLNIYFHSKYCKDSNYARVDLVHRRAIRLLKKLPFRNHTSMAVTISNLGILRLCQAYYGSAESLFNEACTYLEKRHSVTRDLVEIVLLNNLSVAYLRQNQLIEAELVADKAFQIAQSPGIQRKYKKIEAAPLSALAAVRFRLGEFESSYELGKQSLEIFENAPVPSGYSEESFLQSKIFCYLGLTLTSLKLGKKDSLSWFDRAIELARPIEAQISPLALEPLNLVSNELLNNKHYSQAEELLDLAYRIGRENSFHPDAKQTLNYYEKLLLLTNRQTEVENMRGWLMHKEPGLDSLSSISSYEPEKS